MPVPGFFRSGYSACELKQSATGPHDFISSRDRTHATPTLSPHVMHLSSSDTRSARYARFMTAPAARSCVDSPIMSSVTARMPNQPPSVVHLLEEFNHVRPRLRGNSDPRAHVR